MRAIFPALILLVGLGSCFSIAQAGPMSDPFARYLAGLKTGTPESSLYKFAAGFGAANT